MIQVSGKTLLRINYERLHVGNFYVNVHMCANRWASAFVETHME